MNDLNARQQQILKEVGLPQNYGDLSDTQKRAITAIWELLSCTEAKYGMEFCYAGYVAANSLEREKLIAYPAGGRKSKDCFSVCRASNGTVTDDYMPVALRGSFTELVQAAAQDALRPEQVKAYASVLRTTLTAVPEDTGQLADNSAGRAWIFVDGAALTAEQFPSYADAVKQAFVKKNLNVTAKIILLHAGMLRNLTEFNYTDYLKPEFCTARESVCIQK